MEDHPPLLSDQLQAELEELRRLATPHVAASAGRLALLDINPERYPGQIGYEVKGEPKSVAVIERLATMAEPRFPDLLAATTRSEPAMNETADTLSDGGNIMVVTNHGELADIAFTGSALVSNLKNREVEFAGMTIVSKIVSVTGFNLFEDQEPVPAITALSWLFNHTMLSFPRTDSVRNSNIDPGAISTHNTSMIASVKEHLDDGSKLIVMAPSGATDKLISKPGKYGLGAMNRGTAKLMQHENTKVQPVAIWLKDKQAFFEIVGTPREITNHEEAHEVMHDIADVLDRNVGPHRFTYLRDKVKNFRSRH
jgi:hypothetical protein